MPSKEKRVVLAIFLLLLNACSTSVPTPHAATPVPYTRYSALDVFHALDAAGLRTDQPYLAPPSTFTNAPSSGVAFNLWPPDSNGLALPMMSVIATSRPEEMAPWQN